MAGEACVVVLVERERRAEQPGSGVVVAHALTVPHAHAALTS